MIPFQEQAFTVVIIQKRVDTALPTGDIVGGKSQHEGSYCQTDLQMLLQPLLVISIKLKKFSNYWSTMKEHHERVLQHFSIEIFKLSFDVT